MVEHSDTVRLALRQVDKVIREERLAPLSVDLREDILQDFFLYMCRNRPGEITTFAEQGTLMGYARKAIRHLCISNYKKHDLIYRKERLAAKPAGVTEFTDYATVDWQDLLQQQSPRDRRIIESVINGDDKQDVAEAAGIKVRMVNRILQRARAEFKS